MDPAQGPVHPLALMGKSGTSSLVASVPRGDMGDGNCIRISVDDEDGHIAIDFRVVGPPRPFSDGPDAQPSLPGPNLLFAINAAFSALQAALAEDAGIGGEQ